MVVNEGMVFFIWGGETVIECQKKDSLGITILDVGFYADRSILHVWSLYISRYQYVELQKKTGIYTLTPIPPLVE